MGSLGIPTSQERTAEQLGRGRADAPNRPSHWTDASWTRTPEVAPKVPPLPSALPSYQPRELRQQLWLWMSSRRHGTLSAAPTAAPAAPAAAAPLCSQGRNSLLETESAQQWQSVTHTRVDSLWNAVTGLSYTLYTLCFIPIHLSCASFQRHLRSALHFEMQGWNVSHLLCRHLRLNLALGEAESPGSS